ncbi:metabotropic glutamate receptor 3-like [Mercenaria mercenaria]|uniref:metabotropic glutamate receptor 3-like n=1 Tax=Mercenaria mercenaria TaxID=6596 RepID=UPI00234F2573|nr:metabotropic glutamate receptor 3-like [Mercenaria mercenaria]XP_045192245.2 metabotropic glutamate receptor 3-like [Mercenaria mercenaria]
MTHKCFVNLATYCLTAVLVVTFPEDVYKKDYRWIEEGDINIGVILSIHSSNSLFNCTDNIEDIRNVQNVEALSYAVREINNDINILSNLTLGFVVLDDCQSPSIALARAIQFMPSDIRSNTDSSVVGHTDFERTFYDVIGVIGTYTSKLSIIIANVLNLFQLPQISHTATSDVLSDKSRFPYFFRMVPPDRYQVKAIASLLRHFGWSHVSIVYSAGNYGGNGVKELQNTFQAMKNGVCIEDVIEIADGSTEKDFLDILKRLDSYKDTRVVVAYVEIEHAIAISKSVKAARLVNRFIWVGTDSLSLILEEHPTLCDNMPSSISMHPHALNVSTQRFTDHLTQLQTEDSAGISKNPWIADLQKFYGKPTNDNLNSTFLVRKPKFFYKYNDKRVRSIRSTFVDAFLIDSVYALAYAIDSVVKTDCNPTKIGREHVAECVSTKGIFKELKNINFNGIQGELKFNEDGDILTQYEVHQCFAKDLDRPPEIRSVGIWDMDGEVLKMNDRDLLWTRETFPSSSCPKPCSDTIGTIYYFMKQTCCHVCVTCKLNEIVVANATRCEICQEFYWPDSLTRTKCLAIQPVYFGLQNAVSISLCAFAIAGALSCFWIIVILVKYRDEHVIKCFSIELSGIILLGTLLTYGLAASFLSRPNEWKCYINYVGFSLTYTLIYSPLLVKTNRIYRIFNAGRRTTRKPCFISTSSQVVFSFALIFTQVAIVIMSTSLQPPEVSLHMPRRTEKFVELFCNLPHAGLLSSLSFNLILVLICTFYAFKTRKLPDNYKESRYIAFCVDTTLLIWITFVPTYFTTTTAAAKTTILAVSLLLNSSVTITCLFIPRIHSLYKSLKNCSTAKHHYKDFRIVKHVVKRKYSPDMEITARESLSGIEKRISNGLRSSSELMSRDTSANNMTVIDGLELEEISQTDVIRTCQTLVDMHVLESEIEKPSFHLDE